MSDRATHIEAANANLEYAAELLAHGDPASTTVALIALGHAVMALVGDA